MKTRFVVVFWCALLALASASAAPLGTAFTYQGQLTESGNPASGNYDLTFTLFDSSPGGVLIAGPLTNTAVTVSNGLFTTTLDFGGGVFGGDARWLEIAVRTNGGGTFTTLSPCQPLTPSPYALYAPGAGTAATSATAIAVAANGVASASLQTNAVTSDKIANGTIEPEDLNGESFATVLWKAEGNSGTTSGPHFLGTTDNQALELKVDFMRALRLEPNEGGMPNVIGGSPGNFVSPGTVGATIAGGGALNWLGAAFTNRIAGQFGTLGGGAANAIEANAMAATIDGGLWNSICNYASYSAVGGGLWNTVETSATAATIGGGIGNTNLATYAVLAGGTSNRIETAAVHGVIGGGDRNAIAANSPGATIAGGYWNDIASNSGSSTIGGGAGNSIAANSELSTIAGGYWNDIGTNSLHSVIGGGYENHVAANSGAASIAAGHMNEIGSGSTSSAIGGGANNDIAGDSAFATIAGGRANGIGTNSSCSTIGGGSYNTIAAIAGWATVSGGWLNTIQTNAVYATIPGGLYNLAEGRCSLAAGRRAKAHGDGSFVWGDSHDFDVHAWGTNQFVVRATGGYWLFSAVDGLGNPTAGVTLAAGGGFWSPWCDRNAKTNLVPVDGRAVLEKVLQLPITTWNYKTQDPSVRNLGPMAQDFHAAFGLGGDDDSHIGTVNADGVALAAIQGLNHKVEAENQVLKQEIAELKRLVSQLSAKLSGGAQ
jgi:hypothetical protein